MKKVKEIKTTHSFYPDEETLMFNNNSLTILNYMQYEFEPSINTALLALFPNVFVITNELREKIEDLKPLEPMELTDEEVYTLYICNDMMGKVYVSEYWESIFLGFQEDNEKCTPEVMKKVQRFSLLNIRPYLQATELYAFRTGTLPLLGGIKRGLRELMIN